MDHPKADNPSNSASAIPRGSSNKAPSQHDTVSKTVSVQSARTTGSQRQQREPIGHYHGSKNIPSADVAAPEIPNAQESAGVIAVANGIAGAAATAATTTSAINGPVSQHVMHPRMQMQYPHVPPMIMQGYNPSSPYMTLFGTTQNQYNYRFRPGAPLNPENDKDPGIQMKDILLPRNAEQHKNWLGNRYLETMGKTLDHSKPIEENLKKLKMNLRDKRFFTTSMNTGDSRLAVTQPYFLAPSKAVEKELEQLLIQEKANFHCAENLRRIKTMASRAAAAHSGKVNAGICGSVNTSAAQISAGMPPAGRISVSEAGAPMDHTAKAVIPIAASSRAPSEATAPTGSTRAQSANNHLVSRADTGIAPLIGAKSGEIDIISSKSDPKAPFQGVKSVKPSLAANKAQTINGGNPQKKAPQIIKAKLDRKTKPTGDAPLPTKVGVPKLVKHSKTRPRFKEAHSKPQLPIIRTKLDLVSLYTECVFSCSGTLPVAIEKSKHRDRRSPQEETGLGPSMKKRKVKHGGDPPKQSPKRKKTLSTAQTPKTKPSIVEGDETEAVDVHRGVTQRPSGKWQAQVYFAGASRYVGVYNTKRDANTAFVAFKQHLSEFKTKIDIGAISKTEVPRIIEEGRVYADKQIKPTD